MGIKTHLWGINLNKSIPHEDKKIVRSHFFKTCPYIENSLYTDTLYNSKILYNLGGICTDVPV